MTGYTPIPDEKQKKKKSSLKSPNDRHANLVGTIDLFYCISDYPRLLLCCSFYMFSVFCRYHRTQIIYWSDQGCNLIHLSDFPCLMSDGQYKLYVCMVAGICVSNDCPSVCHVYFSSLHFLPPPPQKKSICQSRIKQ